MKARVVYESVLGNTKAVAEAIASGLSELFETETVEVGAAASDAAGLDLLVVGGPTYAWSMSRPSTRKAARDQAAKQGVQPPSQGIGVREWIDGLPGGQGIKAAAFDTGSGSFGILSGGSAAKGEAKQLQRRGYRLIAGPEQFLITADRESTVLKSGELERAADWGRSLARTASRV
ncbi:MAG: flavodoxin family protein [Bauldia sp.]